jgi:ATP-dependent helicase HrpA
VPDPRERPLAKQQAADQAHLLFKDDRSDFLSLLALWQFFDAKLSEKLAHRKVVDACRAHFVSYLRLREWRDVHAQLASEVTAQGYAWPPALPATIDDAKYQSIHMALLAGLIGNIGTLDGDTDGYAGARGIRFFLHPGSGLAKKKPKWVLAAELVETSRLFARCAARIEPEWIEAVAGERVTRDYFDPRWDEGRGEVVASERVQLYGLTLVPRRRVSVRRHRSQGGARRLHSRGARPGRACDEGRVPCAQPEARGRSGGARAQGAAAGRAGRRRHDRVVLRRAHPESVHSRATFEHWRAGVERADPTALHMTRETLMRHAAAHVTEELFPDRIEMAGVVLPLKYRFAPGQPGDGLTLTVPLALLNQIDVARLSWLVPGLIREKVTLLLKALPKAQRSRLVPLPDTVTAFLEAVPAGRGALDDALRGWLAARLGSVVPADVFTGAAMPPHLAMEVRVSDAAGRELATGRDVAALRMKLGEAAQLSFAQAGPSLEQRGLKAGPSATCPRRSRP